jgi:hypothetical protein
MTKSQVGAYLSTGPTNRETLSDGLTNLRLTEAPSYTRLYMCDSPIRASSKC